MPDLWYQVRKKIDDIRSTLPSGIQGPFFNDEFGDTYRIIYAFTADGFTHRELRDYAERVRAELMRVPDVAKIELVGMQDEKIYLEFSTQQLAALGIDRNPLMPTLQAQNAVAPSGVVDAGPRGSRSGCPANSPPRRACRRSTSAPTAASSAWATSPQVRRGYVDPPQPIFRYNGEPAIGMAISMAAGGDVLALGENIKERMRGSTPTCRSASTCISSPTSRMSSRRRSASSPRR